MGVDWRLLNRYKNIELNHEKAETLHDQICEVDAETESDVTNLQLLVSVSQRVLQVKSLQEKEARETIEKLSKRLIEVERLKKENEILKQSLNSDELDTSKRLQDYEEQLNQLQKNLNQKEVELSKSKIKSNEMENKLLEIEKRNEMLSDDVESMKEELDRRGQSDDTFEDSQQINERLSQSNKKVRKLLEEMKSMENLNDELSQKVTDLNHQLKEATDELNRSADEMKQLQVGYVSAHEMNQTLLKEKEFLMKEKMDLESESHASAIKCKELIDSMVKLLAEKDVEINELREQSTIRSPVSSLPLTTGSFDSGKELELNHVKNKLQEATTQLETQNKMVEELQNEMQEMKQFVPKKTGRQQHPNSFSSPIYDAKIHELNHLIQQLEEELKSKDLELTGIKERNKLYESGKYGLSEAMNELKIAHQKFIGKEKQVEELVKELNELKIELNDSQDHVEFLEESAKLKGIDATYDPKSSKTEQDHKMKYLKLQRVIHSLEEQNIELREELRNSKSKLKNSSSDGIINPSSTKGDESIDANQSPETVHYLNERLNKVQDENNQLILGLREVLNALRVSDSKSDVVVECPTLERILSHFESRSVTSEKELANLITIKSELDLVRGHNEQLRIEVKELKIERKKLLAYCTQHILNENKTSDEESTICPDEDPLMDMSEGEVFPTSPPTTHLNMPQVDQEDTAAGDHGNVSDDVIITREEILGRGIKLVIDEVLNQPNEEDEEEHSSSTEERRKDVTEEDEIVMTDISHEESKYVSEGKKEDEIGRKDVIKVKVPCTKCPKAYAALKEVLRRMDKIISIIKQREQDKKSEVKVEQKTASHS